MKAKQEGTIFKYKVVCTECAVALSWTSQPQEIWEISFCSYKLPGLRCFGIVVEWRKTCPNNDRGGLEDYGGCGCWRTCSWAIQRGPSATRKALTTLKWCSTGSRIPTWWPMGRVYFTSWLPFEQRKICITYGRTVRYRKSLFKRKISNIKYTLGT